MAVAAKTGSVQVAQVSRSSSGDGTAVVAGVANKRIRVVGFALTAVGAVVASWKASAGAPDQDRLVSPMPMIAGQAQWLIGDQTLSESVLELPAGAGLMLNLDAAVAVSGAVFYALV